MIKKKWIVYYINSEGYREGVEYIFASDKHKAIEFYRRYFNVLCDCKAIPVFDMNNFAKVRQ